MIQNSIRKKVVSLNQDIKKLYDGASSETSPLGEVGEISDGFHTFNELYHHRAVLFSALCDVLNGERFWKSKKHFDGTMYDGMFIVGWSTPYGDATYHYNMDPYWDIFNCEELPRSPKFDGHSPADALDRIEVTCCQYRDPL